MQYAFKLVNCAHARKLTGPNESLISFVRWDDIAYFLLRSSMPVTYGKREKSNVF